MPPKKSDYEKELDAFYDIEEDEQILSQHSVKKGSYEEVFVKVFASLTDEEKDRLKKENGSEWEHIENHFRKLTKNEE